MWRFRGPRSVKGTKRGMYSRLDGGFKADSNQKSSGRNTGVSDVESPNCSGEPPPGTRSKHRIKLWDSFLQKTRQIKVRAKQKSQSSRSKLEKRARSHDDISSYTVITDNHLQKETATLSAATNTRQQETNVYRVNYRRDLYIHQRAITRSSTTLNDSSRDLYSPAADKINSRVGIENNCHIIGNDINSLNDYSVRTNLTTNIHSRNFMTTDNNSSLNSTFNNEDDDKADDDKEGDEQDEDDAEAGQSLPQFVGSPGENADNSHGGINMAESIKTHQKSYIPSFLQRHVNKKSKPTRKTKTDRVSELSEIDEVSKSKDSSISVTPGVSPSLDATLRTHILTDSHTRESFPVESNLDHGSEVRRRYSDNTIKDVSSDFFDCHDYSSDCDFTSSSNEPSPTRYLKKTRKVSIDAGEKNVDTINKHHSSSSLIMTTVLPGGMDSVNSDIDELANYIVDVDTSKYVHADEDTSSLPKLSAGTAQTCPIQEPTLPTAGHQVSPQHSLFMLNVHLQEGRELVIRDTCGTSDPYVKFKIGNKVLCKSRTVFKNLNPRWDEMFSIPVDDVNKPLVIKVFDYDRTWNDDPMGGADLDLTTLEMNKKTELKLTLSEKDNEEYMGYLLLTCTLVPKSEETNKEQDRFSKTSFFHRSTRSTDSSRKIKMQLWNGVVNIVLVEGHNLVAMDDNGFSDPYVKFRLGMERYRSKMKNKTLNPRWLEQFDLHLYEDQTTQLEIAVYDHDTRGKDDFMGRAVIDLSLLEKDKTHDIKQQLEDGAGTIRLVLTISGTVGNDLNSDLANYVPDARAKDNIISRYGLLNSLRSPDDIGHLEVKVFRAHGLQSADFGGLSDPFCVLELVNDRVQTQTEYKTLNPDWSKVFTFQVKDIHSVLEVTVYDEDRNKKVEFLGKIVIPLLRVKNDERRWYALKDRKMIHKTKGAILLEMNFVFNHVKAGIRTVNPREDKIMLPEQKFKISIMKENINRVSRLIGVFMDTGKFIQGCFDWQSPSRSITAFIVYLVVVWNFELYMLPISLLLIFTKNLVVAQILGNARKEPVEDDYSTDEDDEDDDDDRDKQEEKKSIVERYHAVQEVCLTVQQALDMVASLGERVKNTFTWSVPWLSTLAVIALVAGSIILFYIPLRYLLLAWGINKFTKKLRKPNAISNNELLDFLSRVPSDSELLQYRELRPDIPANTPSIKKKRS